MDAPTFSLIQVCLAQTIGREALEEASDVAQSIARADCAQIARDLFGIVISNLPLSEANEFQSALALRGFPTEVVADEDLPILHEPYSIQRIRILEGALEFTDMMGRSQVRDLDELVFLAGGFLTQSRMKSEPVLKSGFKAYDESRVAMPRVERELRIEEVPEFRLDFFFHQPPHRLRASVTDGVIFFQDRPVKLRDNALLLGMLMDLREILPAERVGRGLLRMDTKNAYPSLKSYEEEIRWHFYRLTPAG